ncbi:MAG TPA: imelysin family protein [Pedobacter sp.]|nr:imelysin family protein [Pedobacter sp.]
MKLFKHSISLALLVLFASILLYACAKKGEPTKEEQTDTNFKNRKEILENVADNIVLPAYANFKVKLDAMVAKANVFTATPNAATLTDFRAAWVDAYVEWQKVELFDFGPAQTEAIRNYFNIYPANEQGINNNIIAGATVNLEFSSAIATQGFPAIDYLINGLGANDASILIYYTTATDATKRIDYLKRLVTRMNTLFTKVNSDWTAYRTQFVSKTGTDASSSMAVMVNSYVLNYERFIRSGKFGIPSGAMMNGVVAAEKVEAFYKKDISLALAKAAQQASIDFFNGKSVKTGTEGTSFKTYMDALGAKDSKTGVKLSQVILDQFTTASSKVNLLAPNFYTEVISNNQKMIDVYTEMQKLVRLLKVDMTSAFSITITYTDNDGD